jgi:hypothetical protein
MLDSAELKSALKAATDADLVVAVSNALYSDMLQHGYGDLAPDSFTPVNISLPDKGFAAYTWIHVPGHPAGGVTGTAGRPRVSRGGTGPALQVPSTGAPAMTSHAVSLGVPLAAFGLYLADRHENRHLHHEGQPDHEPETDPHTPPDHAPPDEGGHDLPRQHDDPLHPLADPLDPGFTHVQADPPAPFDPSDDPGSTSDYQDFDPPYPDWNSGIEPGAWYDPW